MTVKASIDAIMFIPTRDVLKFAFDEDLDCLG